MLSLCHAKSNIQTCLKQLGEIIERSSRDCPRGSFEISTEFMQDVRSLLRFQIFEVVLGLVFVIGLVGQGCIHLTLYWQTREELGRG